MALAWVLRMKLSKAAFTLAVFAVGCGSATSNVSGDSGIEHSVPEGGAHEGGKEGGRPAEAGPTDSGLKAGQCRTQSDCTGSAEGCLQFTLPPICKGSCTTGTHCGKDSDCADAGAGFICTVFCQCAWTGGADGGPGGTCLPGCTTDPECGPGHSCSPTHHCVPSACKKPSDCGADFTCTQGACGPLPCKTDSDCTGGDHCTVVAFPGSSQLACFPSFGVCMAEGA